VQPSIVVASKNTNSKAWLPLSKQDKRHRKSTDHVSKIYLGQRRKYMQGTFGTTFKNQEGPSSLESPDKMHKFLLSTSLQVYQNRCSLIEEKGKKKLGLYLIGLV
jgi:hypothetical protein